jgi:hypothetical protein
MKQPPKLLHGMGTLLPAHHARLHAGLTFASASPTHSLINSKYNTSFSLGLASEQSMIIIFSKSLRLFHSYCRLYKT